MAEKDFEFARRLERLLEEAGIKKKKLADLIDVSPSAIGTYIKEGRIPEAPILLRIARLLNKTTEELLTGEKGFEVYGLFKREAIEGASLYTTSNGLLPECVIEEKLGIRPNTLDDWLAENKKTAKEVIIREEEAPCRPQEDPVLKDMLEKVKTLYKEGDFDVKARLRGTIEVLLDEMRTQREKEKGSKTEDQKKGA